MLTNKDNKEKETEPLVKLRKKNSKENFLNDKSNSDDEDASNEYKIASLEELNRGDHIILVKKLQDSVVDDEIQKKEEEGGDKTASNKNEKIKVSKKFCHSILIDVDHFLSTIHVIYYDDPQLQCPIEEFGKINSLDNSFHSSLSSLVSKNSKIVDKNNLKEQSSRQRGVKSQYLEVNLNKIDIFKVDYDIAKEKTLTNEETINKALELNGSIKYNVFQNNDSHFCIVSIHFLFEVKLILLN
jgi:hypothetical protein